MLETIDRIRDDISTLDRRAVAALAYTAFGLASIFYLQKPESAAALLRGTRLEWLGQLIVNSTDNNLPVLAWWVVVATAFYIVIPVFIIKYSWRAGLADLA